MSDRRVVDRLHQPSRPMIDLGLPAVYTEGHVGLGVANYVFGDTLWTFRVFEQVSHRLSY